MSISISSPLRIAPLVLCALLWSRGAGAEELSNDGFSSGQAVNFQAGFIEGEIAAVRLEPTIACPCTVEEVTLLFGGTTDTLPVVLRIWDDEPATLEPGAPLFVDSFALTASNDQLAIIDLSGANVVVTGPFRVGIEFAHAGLPSVASDTDGSVDAARNFILADFSPLGFFWFQSPDLGVGGDWILRARIEPETGTSGGGGVAAVPAVPFWGVAALAPALATCGAAGLRRPRRRRRPDGASARDRSDHSVPRMLRNQPWSS
jgi:hypothetical protein